MRRFTIREALRAMGDLARLSLLMSVRPIILSGSFGLLSLALAGGGTRAALTGVTPTSLSVREALNALPGVTVVEAPPVTQDFAVLERYYSTHPASYVVRVSVAGNMQQVFVTPAALESSPSINQITTFVEQAETTPAQRRALVQVALGLFNICWPAEAQALTGLWSQVIAEPWENTLGWQERHAGVLTLGWSGRDGMYNARTARAGLELKWLSGAGRCTF